jgi:hypothetical protein
MSWPHGAPGEQAVAEQAVAEQAVVVRSHQDFFTKILACEARVLCCVAGVSLS